MRITKQMLLAAKPEAVKRLAHSLRLRGTDDMSHRHVCSLINWLFTRREKRARGLIRD